MSVAEDIKKLEKYDEELHLIVDYVYDFKVDSTLALLNAKCVREPERRRPGYWTAAVAHHS